MTASQAAAISAGASGMEHQEIVTNDNPVLAATERHYTLREIADMWKISYQTARRMFQDEPGVLAFSMPRLCGQGRPHISLRVPASVLERFHKQRSGAFLAEIQRGRRRI